MPQVSSKVWCNGSTLSTRSLCPSGNSGASEAMSDVRLKCESITPFGVPVVPLV